MYQVIKAYTEADLQGLETVSHHETFYGRKHRVESGFRSRLVIKDRIRERVKHGFLTPI